MGTGTDAPADGLWWALMIVDSAVSMGYFVYGVRQKAGLPLAMGIALNVVPGLAPNGTMSLALTVLIGVGYYVVQQALRR